MKIKLIYVILTISGMLAFGACNNPPRTHRKPQPNLKQQPTTKIKYYCPTHPSYIRDEPGVCPKCRMKLIIKDERLKN